MTSKHSEDGSVKSHFVEKFTKREQKRPTGYEAVSWLKKFLRYTDYISAAELYLKNNFFLKKPLNKEHIKERILGHWGTVPGLNFIYGCLNYLISQKKCEILLIVGPGHGAPSVLANLFVEGTLEHFYPEFSLDTKGTGKLIHDFSWPRTLFPSHVTPTVPGSILEGGELGYSLATAYGAAFDNPNLIVGVIVGDGEAETAALNAAWHSNKFLNPRTCGAVLPIVHINGYKISNPTIYGTMSNEELKNLFLGYGYEPLLVELPQLEEKMLKTVFEAYRKIRSIQKKARAKTRSHASRKNMSSGKNIQKPIWPVILLRSPKGWKGVHEFLGHQIEGSFHSHGVPIENPKENPLAIKTIEKWLKSYKIEELIDEKGRPKKEIMKYVPNKKFAIGANLHAIGGNFYKPLKLPKLSEYETKFKKRGATLLSSMLELSAFLRDILKRNPDNFRILCPDEMESNKLEKVFEATKRAYMWPIKKTDENIDPNGKVMEMLSENTLQGWLQGYILTGRHGIFVSYEAFTPIITSMVDQYAKFLKQSFHVPWRKPIPSAIYLLTSLGWRQDHNGYSHQNPSFVSNILQKHGEFCQIYYPADSNSLLAAMEETLCKTNAISVIVAGKTPLPEWLTLEEARKQAQSGIGIWEWVGGRNASKDPDVVLASAGDYVTQEALLAVKLCRKLIPELKIRYVNVSELTSISLGDTCSHRHVCATEEGVNHYFTKDKPVIFNYHGYINDVEHILWPYTTSDRFSLHGYKEEGSTTTPFDMKIRNGVSCYHLMIDMLRHAIKTNKAIAKKHRKICVMLEKKISEHQNYIQKQGDDPEEIKNLRW